MYSRLLSVKIWPAVELGDALDRRQPLAETVVLVAVDHLRGGICDQPNRALGVGVVIVDTAGAGRRRRACGVDFHGEGLVVVWPVELI